MNRDKIRVAGYVALIIMLAMLIIFFDDIKAVLDGIMVEQAGSLVEQLLR